MRNSLLGLFALACSLMYGAGLNPLNDVSVDLYPFSAVGEVSIENGQTATGTLIADNLVLTNAVSFVDAVTSKVDASSFVWTWKSPDDNQAKEYEVESYSVFNGFEKAVEEGISSAIALEKSVLILQLKENLGSEASVVLNLNNLQNDEYRMIVGYAGDLYQSGDVNAYQLHATGSGEAVLAQFGNVEGRLYHSGDLKAASDALGAPVFSYFDGVWSLDGMVVENDPILGAVRVVSIDSEMGDFLLSVLEETGGLLRTADDVDSVNDPNGKLSSATNLKVGYGKLFSIAPEGDVDYQKFTVQQEGNYTIESYGDLDVNGTLLNENGQYIVDDDDSAGSLNFRIGVLLKTGTYYLLTKPNSNVVLGSYGISLINDNDTSIYLDNGLSSNNLINLTLDSDSLDYRLANAGEVDAFRLVVSEPGHFILKTGGDLDLKAKLVSVVSGAIVPYDSSEIEAVWSENDDFTGMSGNAVLDVFLQAGEYVVLVEAREAGEYGPYQLTTDFYSEPLSIADSNDDNGGFVTAVDWIPGSEVKDEFGDAGDRDSFKFVVDETEDISIAVESDAAVVWYLFDEDLNRIAFSGSEVFNPVIEQSLQAGTYYLMLAGMADESYSFQ